MKGKLLILSACLLPLLANAEDSSQEQRIKALEQRVMELEQLLQAQLQQSGTHSPMMAHDTSQTSASSQQASKPEPAASQTMQDKSPSMTSSLGASQFTLYGSLRPTLEYRDRGKDQWDIGDALSRIGVKAETEFLPGWRALAQGEWKIRIDDNGRFGEARLAFAGVDSPYGKLTLGRQRPVQYTLVAEYTDIFNNANSPFGYNQESPFFVDNALIYQVNIELFTLMASAVFDDSEYNSGADIINLGAGFDWQQLHLGLTWLAQDKYVGDIKQGDEQVWGAVAAYTWHNGIYAAASYQSKEYDFVSANNRDGDTFDGALALPLGKDYKLKLGYFWFKDGIEDFSSLDYDGYNLTLEWQPLNNVRLHLEYLAQNYDNREDESIVAAGIRYDFDLNWRLP
ncbi:porin [Shewanella algae]|uniref:porin n=1 Tax=Shewanella algae TaxID=38313 RepID=UPI001AADE451|nr:porin [Shewanella algae]MBO2675842.1 porin [Shewanella algae]